VVKINKKLEYALIVLKFMHERNASDLTTARQVCDQFKTPFDTTAKVMQVMNNKGILSSSQGVKGGYQLATDLNSISYLQLCELIEGKKFAQDCEQMACSLISSCNITGPIKKLNQYLTYFFSGISIAELLRENSSPVSLVNAIENFRG
jgi:Rrf2 family protein